MRNAILLFAAATMFMTTGCVGRILGEGMGKVTGPKGVVVTVRPAGNLGEYSRFEAQPFTDDFGGRTPPQVLSEMPRAIGRALAEKGIHNRTDGKTLLIRGKILSYEPSVGTIDQAFGPFEELIARVYFVDKDTGKVIGEYNCIGRSNVTVNQGVQKKIQGLADAVANAIAQHYLVR